MSPTPDAVEGVNLQGEQIDGASLRRIREARGLSVADAARKLTLSRVQVAQIEGGGISAFYGPRHKWLAARKYANVLGRQTLSQAAPGTAEHSGGHADEVSPDSPFACAAGRTSIPDWAKSDPYRPSVQIPPDAVIVTDVRGPADPPLLLAALLVAAGILAYAVAYGLHERPFLAALWREIPLLSTGPAQRVIDRDGQPAKHDLIPSSASPAAASAARSPPPAACGFAPAGAQTPAWTPPYVRKPGTRLFMGGPVGTDVCISDSTGKRTRLVMQPGPLQAVDGLPPYLVQAESLGQLQMFMQGLKVRVPPQAMAIRVLPGQHVAPQGEAAGARLPES